MLVGRHWSLMQGTVPRTGHNERSLYVFGLFDAAMLLLFPVIDSMQLS